MPANQLEDRKTFETAARSEGWRCSRCGKPVTFEDRESYQEAKRCRRCHDEVDTESGSINRS